MKIFLIGFMGSGKTSLGKQVAQHIKYHHYDLDKIIETKYNTTISEIFSEHGESYFRKIEHETLLDILKIDYSYILSTGGGTPCFYNNIELMLKSGLVVYLKVSNEILYNRLINSNKERPLIKNQDNFSQWLNTKINEREQFYNKANVIINADNINAEMFVNYLKMLNFQF
jgi:shikimate kinase